MRKEYKDAIITNAIYICFSLLLLYSGLDPLQKPIQYLTIMFLFAYNDIRSYKQGLYDR